MDNDLIGRRRVLALLGGLGAVAFVGCGDDDDTASGSSSTTTDAAGDTATTTTSSSGGSSDCSTPIPEETAGPYPGDGTNGPDVLDDDGVVRSDITSSFGSSSTVAEGVPLTITLALTDTAAGCAPLAGAAVYLWHCDREGRYSLYSDGVTEENYLRGVQESDADGRVTFRSIFPACYSGRWPHIHFEVYESVDAAVSGGTRYATSQVALPEDSCDEVFATDGYEQSVTNLAQVSLTSDGVFGDDGGESQLGTVSGNPTDGYTVELTVPVDTTSTSTGGAGFGGDGAPAGAPPGGGPGGPPPG